MTTKLLMSTENPDGWRLEDILAEIQNDIVRRGIHRTHLLKLP